jgi:hypothetical protein
MATTKATTLAHTLGGISSDISTAEINRLDGLTGDIQTQITALDTAKAPKASPTFTGDSVFDTSTLKVDATNNRVGIGTASPANDVEIGAYSGDKTLCLTSGTNGNTFIRMNDGDSSEGMFIKTTGSASIAGMSMNFGRNWGGDETKVTILGDGKFGIGTTTPSDPCHVIGRTSNTNNPLLVHKVESICTGTVANGFGARIQFNTSMTGQNNVELGSVGFINADVGGAFGQFVVYIRPNSTSVLKFKVHNNGDTYTNDGSVSSLSDVRAKKDIVDLTDGLDIVNKLKPKTFKYNGKTEMGGDDGVIRYGFIADEVQSVAPHYVEETNEMLDGEWVTDFKSLSTTRMIPMLVNAVQELSAKVTALENA